MDASNESKYAQIMAVPSAQQTSYSELNETVLECLEMKKKKSRMKKNSLWLLARLMGHVHNGP